FALVGVHQAVAAAVGGLAVRRAPLAAGGRVSQPVVGAVVALLARVALHHAVAAEGAVLTLGGAAVVLAVAVVRPVAEGGVLRRRARVPAIALLAAGLDAVAARGAALRLVGGEPAERELEVRLGRVPVAGEDRDLVGVGRGAGRGRRLEPGLGGGQVTLPAVAGGVACGAGRVELDLGDRIDGVG